MSAERTRRAFVVACGLGLIGVALWFLWRNDTHIEQPRSTAEQTDGIRAVPREASTGEATSTLAQRMAAETGSAPSGLLVFRNLWDARPVPDLPLMCRCVADGRDQLRETTTEPDGSIELPQGEWHLTTSSPFLLSETIVSVTSRPRLVWLDQVRRVTVEVVDAQHRPIEGAFVRTWSAGSPLGPSQSTNSAGRTSIEVAGLASTAVVSVFQAAYEPRTVPLSFPSIPSPDEHLRVVLTAGREPWSLLVSDPDGHAVAAASVSVRPRSSAIPRFELGSTDATGRLEVAGRWMLADHFFELGGDAYPMRSEPPAERPPVAAPPVRHLIAPRRVEGTLHLHGWTPRNLEWQFLDPVPSRSGTGIQLPSLVSRLATDRFAATLPSQWPVRIVALCNGHVVVDEVHEVAGEGWNLTVSPSRPAMRRISVTSLTAPITQVRVNGSSPYVCFPGDDPSGPVSTARFELPVDSFVTATVSLASGVDAILNGRPGRNDAAITLAPPRPIPCTFDLATRDGAPLLDVIVSLSRVGGSRFEACKADGWKWALGGSRARLEVDALGRAHTQLLPGTYEVMVGHLGARDVLGQSWPPDQPPQITVADGGTTTFRFDAAMPRYAQITLVAVRGSRPPSQWTLARGPYLMSCQGPCVGVWLTQDAQDLRILDPSGRELNGVSVPQGTEPIHLEVLVSE